MRPGDGGAGTEEQGGIDGRDAPRPHRCEVRSLRPATGPAAGKFRPQRKAVVLHHAAEVGDREDAHVEQCTEEGGKEHHFGGDEPHHAVAEGTVLPIRIGPTA
ncbi:hypothetical protein SDC9_205887 [bioreactor metagenome]|uniref:Uncharacterized protein n=1 Tax=bioreactor metagenome TaxID=1076179 RepID=A0A645J414_9ZZZZ